MESNSKSRAHTQQQLAKFYKDYDYEVYLYKKYGDPWNWD